MKQRLRIMILRIVTVCMRKWDLKNCKLYFPYNCFVFKNGNFYSHLILISLSKFNIPLIGSFYVTHAAWALQSHDMSGEGIKPRITDILFWPHKDMESLPGWVISPMPGPPPRQHKHERQYTPITHPFIPTRRIWNDDYSGQMIFGDLVGLKVPYIYLTGVEKPRKKPHPGNLSRPGIELRPAAWQARMLPLAPQRWTTRI